MADHGGFDDAWELEAGIVRPYLFTKGRTQPSPSVELPVEAVLTSTALARATASSLPAEQRRIVECCAIARSVAELAVAICAPITVTRVLVADLYTVGMIDVHEVVETSADVALLHRMIERVKAIA
jgi:hypothetical protein